MPRSTKTLHYCEHSHKLEANQSSPKQGTILRDNITKAYDNPTPCDFISEMIYHEFKCSVFSKAMSSLNSFPTEFPAANQCDICELTCSGRILRPRMSAFVTRSPSVQITKPFGKTIQP